VKLETPLAPLSLFALDPTLLHLNHGSWGAAPRAALDAQAALRARLESATMRFMVREWQGLLDGARAHVAGVVGADPEDLVMITNPTSGVASILGSRAWAPGERVLVTDHGYRACKNAILRLGEQRGVGLATVTIPLPVARSADVVERVVAAAAADPSIRVVLLDQVTSPTGLVLDVAAVGAGLRERAPHAELLVDAAHSPGQLAIDVGSLARAGAAYAVATCHKWLCAPKGASLLWSRRDRRDALRPVVTSHGETAGVGPPNRFHARFDWSGTHDPTPFLSAPAAIDAVGEACGGWPAIRERNHALVLAARDLVLGRLGGGARAIAPDDMHGSMAAIPITLPDGAAPLAFQAALIDDGIEIPIVDHPTYGTFVRLSAHVYNALPDYARLADELLRRGVRGRALA
jgi:isopenicillin-N epimerase